MKKLTILVALLWSSTALATTPTIKQIDDIMNSTGGNSIAVPNGGSSDSFATLKGTQTFTSGSTWNGAAIGVAYGGTGLTSVSANAILYGAGTSPLVPLAMGTQYQVLQAGASAPVYGALNLGQSAAITGTLPVANGGTSQTSLTAHYVLVGNGTSGVTQVSPTSNVGYVLTSNGTSSDPSFQAVASAMPTLNGTAASPLSITAAGGIGLATPTYINMVFIKASTSGTTVITATPSISACTAAGQVLKIVSESSTNLVTIQNNADLSGSQVELNGPWTSGENNGTPYTLDLICDGASTPEWVEISRNN